MAWTGEVISHALILTCPLAACFGAKLLARLTEQLEMTNRGILVLQSYARCHGNAQRVPRWTGWSVSDNHAEQRFDEKRCLQYNNAAFCYQVLSVDEYASRMHVSSLSRHQSAGGSPCAVTPSGCLGPDQQPSGGAPALRAATDGGTHAVRLSCRSISACLTSVSSCGPTFSNSDLTASTRSSLDVPQLSDIPLTSDCSAQHDRRGTSAAAADGGDGGDKDVLEGSYFGTSLQRCRPTLEGSLLDKSHACIWRDAAAAAVAAAAAADAPCTPRTVATPPRPLASPVSDGGHCPDTAVALSSEDVPPWRRVQSDPARHGLEDISAAVGPVPTPLASSGRRPRAGETPRSASHGGAVVSHDRQAQRHWVPAGARSMPQPLPSPIVSRGVSPELYSSFNSRVLSGLQEDGIAACSSGSRCGVASVPHSPPQSARSRPCGIVVPGAAPTSPSACPVGLSKAPALPLPDGVSLESAVPPALRYYLEQARAAGAQTDAPECDTVATVAFPSLDGDGAGSAGRPGFVRATVEQLNTQRLVCCHVTPFAAATTSRKTRPLAQRAAWAK